MKYCSKCGFEAKDNVDMCNNCSSLLFQSNELQVSIEEKKSRKKWSKSISSIATILGILGFSVIGTISFFTPKIINFLENKALDRTKQNYTQALLYLFYDEFDKSQDDFLKIINKNNKYLELKLDSIYWYNHLVFKDNDYYDALIMIENILNTNSELINEKIIRNFITTGLNIAAYYEEDEYLNYFLRKYNESNKYFNFIELEYLIRKNRFSFNDENIFDYTLKNTIDFKNDFISRVTQYNIWSQQIKNGDMDSFQFLFCMAIFNYIYPENFSNDFLCAYLPLWSTHTYSPIRRLMTSLFFHLAFDDILQYSEMPNYNQIKILFDDLAMSVGYVNPNIFNDNLDHSIFIGYVEELDKNRIDLLSYQYFQLNNKKYYLLIWADNTDEDDISGLPSIYLKGCTYEVICVNINNEIDIVYKKENEYEVPSFLKTYHNNKGFIIISRSNGTHVDIIINYLEYTNDNEFIDHELVEDNYYYHTSAIYKYDINDKQYITWKAEVFNFTQPNIVRKIPYDVSLLINGPNDYFISEEYHQLYAMLQNIFNDQIETQLKIMDKITISGKTIINQDFVEVMKDPSSYYKNSVSLNVQAQSPDIIPEYLIFILEKRFEFTNGKNDGYVLLIKNNNGNFTIDKIYEFKNTNIISCLL